MRSLIVILISACAAPLIEAERNHCLNSIECEFGERCMQQRCVTLDAGNGAADTGFECQDPDNDGAHQGGLFLQSEELQIDRHVCPQTPDRYRYNLTTSVQVNSWVVAENGTAPKLQLVARDGQLPSTCEGDQDTCAEGGRLTGLNAARVDTNFDLGVVAAEAALGRYEMGFRVGRPCEERSDCGSGRCVRALAERPNQVGNQGICVFASELTVAPNCDAVDPSSDHAESARDAGDLASLELAQVPLCQHDNDWYAVSLDQDGTVTRAVSLVSLPAQDGELTGLNLFIGLYAATDLQPIRFSVLHFATGSETQTLSLANLSAGDYRLRVTQINKRSTPITYTIQAP